MWWSLRRRRDGESGRVIGSRTFNDIHDFTYITI
jgi:hypothetical protein